MKKLKTQFTSAPHMHQKFHYVKDANIVDSSSVTLTAWPITMLQVSFCVLVFFFLVRRKGGGRIKVSVIFNISLKIHSKMAQFAIGTDKNSKGRIFMHLDL